MEPVPLQDFQALETEPGVPKLVVQVVQAASVIPLPAAFWRGGMSLISANNGGSAYFLGHTIPGGDRRYFLVALAVKSPIPTQLLFMITLLSIAIAIGRRRLRTGDWCYLLPGFLYFGMASLSSLQLGVRLVLPAVAFFILLTGRAFALAASRRRLRVLDAVLMVCLAGTTAIAYPNYISFFNLWVGDSWRAPSHMHPKTYNDFAPNRHRAAGLLSLESRAQNL